MNLFQYVRPNTISEASSFLKQNSETGKIIAGGMDLLGEMKQNLISPQTLVSLSNIPELKTIEETDTAITIGAAVTLSEIIHHQAVQKYAKALVEAAAVVGSPQIRHAGTIGGNLCQRPRCWYYRDENYPCFKKGGSTCFSITGKNRYHAILGGGPCFMVHPSDCAPALLALNAKVYVLSADGEKSLSMDKFIVKPTEKLTQETALAKQDIVTKIEIPKQTFRSTYLKFKERESFDWALSSIALAMDVQSGVCRSAKMVLGGVAPFPWRAESAETILAGKEITEELAASASAEAVKGAFALNDNEWKIPITKAIVKEAVLRLKEDNPPSVSEWNIY